MRTTLQTEWQAKGGISITPPPLILSRRVDKNFFQSDSNYKQILGTANLLPFEKHLPFRDKTSGTLQHSIAVALPSKMSSETTNPPKAIPESTTPPSVLPTCKVILANTIAKSLLAEVEQGLKELDFKPKLVGILGNKDPAAQVYAEYSAKTCKEK